MEGKKEYLELMIDTAIFLWGTEEAEKMRNHIETTAAAIHRVANVKLNPMSEPAARLRLREKP